MLFWFRWARKTDYTITASELFRTAVRDQFRGANNCNDCGIIEGGSVDAETSVTSVCGGGRGGGKLRGLPIGAGGAVGGQGCSLLDRELLSGKCRTS